MPKDDLLKIVKWIGYIYTPIVILIIGIFILVEYREHELSKLRSQTASPSPSAVSQ